MQQLATECGAEQAMHQPYSGADNHHTVCINYVMKVQADLMTIHVVLRQVVFCCHVQGLWSSGCNSHVRTEIHTRDNGHLSVTLYNNKRSCQQPHAAA